MENQEKEETKKKKNPGHSLVALSSSLVSSLSVFTIGKILVILLLLYQALYFKQGIDKVAWAFGLTDNPLSGLFDIFGGFASEDTADALHNLTSVLRARQDQALLLLNPNFNVVYQKDKDWGDFEKKIHELVSELENAESQSIRVVRRASAFLFDAATSLDHIVEDLIGGNAQLALLELHTLDKHLKALLESYNSATETVSETQATTRELYQLSKNLESKYLTKAMEMSSSKITKLMYMFGTESEHLLVYTVIALGLGAPLAVGASVPVMTATAALSFMFSARELPKIAEKDHDNLLLIGRRYQENKEHLETTIERLKVFKNQLDKLHDYIVHLDNGMYGIQQGVSIWSRQRLRSRVTEMKARLLKAKDSHDKFLQDYDSQPWHHVDTSVPQSAVAQVKEKDKEL